MKIPSSILTMLAGILITVISYWYGRNHGLLPTAASREAPLVDGLFDTMMTIGTGIFLLVSGVLFIAAFRFRRQPDDTTDAAPVHGNIPLEILWTAIPAVIVLGLSVYSFEVYRQEGGIEPTAHGVAHAPAVHRMAHGTSDSSLNATIANATSKLSGAAIAAPLPIAQVNGSVDAAANGPTGNINQERQQEVLQDPATAAVRKELPQSKDAPSKGVVSPNLGATPENQGKPPEFVVNVTGLQFAWIFTYPDTGVVSSELHLPVDREVQLNISANDVIHAFWVPEFRVKQDAVPGRQTELRLTPTVIGEYPLICAELCGAYHGAMKTKVMVETAANFDTWINEQKQTASQSDLKQAISLQSTDQSPDTFLAPYTHDLGITPATLAPMQPMSHAGHSAS